MNELREQGIYALPDGREFVAHAVFRGGYVLFTPSDWEFFGMHLYETNAAGQVRSKGQATLWRINDLTDTGRTARSRSRSGAAPQLFAG